MYVWNWKIVLPSSEKTTWQWRIFHFHVHMHISKYKMVTLILSYLFNSLVFNVVPPPLGRWDFMARRWFNDTIRGCLRTAACGRGHLRSHIRDDGARVSATSGSNRLKTRGQGHVMGSDGWHLVVEVPNFHPYPCCWMIWNLWSNIPRIKMTRSHPSTKRFVHAGNSSRMFCFWHQPCNEAYGQWCSYCLKHPNTFPWLVVACGSIG